MNTQEELVTIDEAAGLMGLKRSTITFLIQSGLISVEQERPGRQRGITRTGLLALGIYRPLANGGMSIPAIRPLCRFVQDTPDDEMDADIAAGKTILAAAGDAMPPRLFSPAEFIENRTGQVLMLVAIDLEACAKQLEAGLEKHAARMAAANN